MVSSPVAGSAVTTARTWPDASPSKRTRRPGTVVDGTSTGGRPMATAVRSATPAAASRSAAPVVSRPDSSLPGQTGWTSAAPVATTISAGWTMEHPGRRPDHDERTGVDRDDLVAGTRVEDADRAPGTFGRRGRSEPASAPADDRDVDLIVAERDLPPDRRCREVRGGHHGERRQPIRRVPDHTQPGPRRDLAGPHVRDAVDHGQAVAAVTREAQRPATARHLARPQDRDRHRVARLERDRPPVDDDPTAAGRRSTNDLERPLTPCAEPEDREVLVE